MGPQLEPTLCPETQVFQTANVQTANEKISSLAYLDLQGGCRTTLKDEEV